MNARGHLGVEQALARELWEFRRRRVYDAYAAAAEDPSFRAEMEEVRREFEPPAGDGLEDGEWSVAHSAPWPVPLEHLGITFEAEDL